MKDVQRASVAGSVVRRSGLVIRTRALQTGERPLRVWASLLILLLGLAGCNSAPEGHERVRALVRPQGRAVAFVPFSVAGLKTAKPEDGILLGELAANDLRQALPDLKVVGPSAMGEFLARQLDEASWPELGQKLGVALLVVGQITFLDAWHDKELMSREGTIGLRFRVLDVSKSPPTRLARVSWRRAFPEGVGEKFDERYVSMNEVLFRQELLKCGARSVAGVFYDHFERRRPVSQMEVESIRYE